MLGGSAWGGYNTKTLSFTLTQAMLKYTFKVVATNSEGETSSNAVKVTLPAIPKFSVQPVSQVGNIGDRITFTSDAGSDVTYQWYCSKNNGGTWNLMAGSAWSGYNTRTLSFTLNQTTLKYTFKVVATNADGETSSDVVKVTLPVIPEFSVQPVSQVGNIGDRITFTSDAGSDVTYQWYCSKNNGGTWNLMAGSAWNGYNTRTLSFTLTQAMLKYSFKVVATNDVGSTDSDIVVVTVPTAPEFILQPVSQSAKIGDQITFTSDAGSDATYQWYCSKNNGGTWNLMAGSAWNGYNTRTLSFTLTEATLKYTFKVVASNEIGDTDSDIVKVTLSGITIDGVTYDPITENTCEVASYAGSASALVIPQEIEDNDGVIYTVTQIGEEAFMDNKSLVSIDLPDTVKVIRARAFKNCSNLSEMK